jgi:penicillin-binding protein 1B
LFVSASAPAGASSIDEELGRSEVRIYSAPYELPIGRTVAETGLPRRLERLGYQRVRGRRPSVEGEYFWGFERFWIYRHAHRLDGRQLPARLVGVRLARPDGRILGPADPQATGDAGDGEAGESDASWAQPGGVSMPYLEPEVLAESFSGDRAARRPVPLARLPEHVWRPLLAIEDARFFDHPGIDYRGIARALLANAKAGKVRQGGSTLTQQLIKMRDLSPKRSVGRKASEALRALALEAEYDKREILECYLNHVYYGQVEGLAIHGIGAAAQAFFAKPAERLTLAEAATLAGIIQSPNRLSPARHPERARERRDVVLGRLLELGWLDRAAIEAARGQRLGLNLRLPDRRPAAQFLGWVASVVEEETPRRAAKGRGAVVETGLDPYLQELAEEAVISQLDRLRRGSSRLRGSSLSAALVTLDGASGRVLAYVGGDPRAAEGLSGGGFDRARNARRQPGSTLKPLVLLEAFDRCAGAPRDRRGGGALTPASRVADEPLRLDLPSGRWSPTNADDRFHGVVDVRTALADSYNVPFVRIARWCGFEATAQRLRRAGLVLPKEVPPSFVLGAVEVSPLELAGAYTVFATPGVAATPRPVERILTPGGRGLERLRARTRSVVRPASAYLVRDLMRQAVASGTAQAAQMPGIEVAGKTGTSSERRDAWFAGQAGSLVTVVWVGLDDGSPLGLAGATAAAPLWKAFMERAVPARSGGGPQRPDDIVEARIDPRTGLRVRGWSQGREELFRRGALPPRDRLLRRDEPLAVVR